MTEIISVNTLEDRVLDIALNNGSLLLVNLEPLFERTPPYPWLKKGIALPRPKTDGESIVWPDGSRLTLGELYSLLGMPPGKRRVEECGEAPILQIAKLEAMDFETLSVDFNNGSVVVLNLRTLLADNPTCAALRRWPTLSRPTTDGVNIRWEDGPALSLTGLFKMIGCDQCENIKSSKIKVL